MNPPFTIIVVDGFHYEPRRVHPTPKRSERVAYHRRVQKKWNKRFGHRVVEDLKRGEFIVDERKGVVFCRREEEAMLRATLCSD